MLVAGLLVAALLTAVLPRLSAPAPTVARDRASAAGAQTMVGAMSLLILVVAIRSWTQLGFTTFMPFYWKDVLHGDPRLVGTLLAVFLGAGAIGTLAAGPVADRVGVRRYVVSVFLLATPLAVGFLFVSGGPLVFVLLALLGFVLVSTFTVSVVLGQAYRRGTRHGLRAHRGLRDRRGWPARARSAAADHRGSRRPSASPGHAPRRFVVALPPGTEDRCLISPRTASRSC